MLLQVRLAEALLQARLAEVHLLHLVEVMVVLLLHLDVAVLPRDHQLEEALLLQQGEECQAAALQEVVEEVRQLQKDLNQQNQSLR